MQSGKWVQRVPKSLHTRLATRAKQEGISLNTLVVSMISEGLGKRYEIPKDNSAFKSSHKGINKKAKSTALKNRHPIQKKSTTKRKAG